ncbi:hypothetical protein, partial [Petrachloros mirabilis]
QLLKGIWLCEDMLAASMPKSLRPDSETRSAIKRVSFSRALDGQAENGYLCRRRARPNFRRDA